jgi:hypothetical protein
MRFAIAVIVVCGLIAWLVASQSSSGVGIQPRPGDIAALDNAAASGKLHQNPERRALRQAILDAGSRVESSPCDPQRRRELLQAEVAYNRYVTTAEADESETYALNDGTVVKTARYFNDVIRDAIRRANIARCDTGGASDERFKRRDD